MERSGTGKKIPCPITTTRNLALCSREDERVLGYGSQHVDWLTLDHSSKFPLFTDTEQVAEPSNVYFVADKRGRRISRLTDVRFSKMLEGAAELEDLRVPR